MGVVLYIAGGADLSEPHTRASCSGGQLSWDVRGTNTHTHTPLEAVVPLLGAQLSYQGPYTGQYACILARVILGKVSGATVL